MGKKPYDETTELKKLRDARWRLNTARDIYEGTTERIEWIETFVGCMPDMTLEQFAEWGKEFLDTVLDYEVRFSEKEAIKVLEEKELLDGPMSEWKYSLRAPYRIHDYGPDLNPVGPSLVENDEDGESEWFFRTHCNEFTIPTELLPILVQKLVWWGRKAAQLEVEAQYKENKE